METAVANEDESENPDEKSPDVAPPQSSGDSSPVTFSLKRSTLKKAAIAGGTIVIVAGAWFAFQSFNQSKVFDRAAEACFATYSRGVTIDSGGRAMYLNGEGEESSGVAVSVQVCILRELDVSDSVFDRIAGTTSLMGAQTAEWGNLEANWTYHPRNGLNISIERK